jgi:hypothetical protein
VADVTSLRRARQDFDTLGQDCQMVYFQTNLGILLKALEKNILVYFMPICNFKVILRI